MENSCPKCGGMEIEEDELRMSGRGLTRYFNIQNRCFEPRTCNRCGYTEFYRQINDSTWNTIIDLFTG